LLRVPEGMDPCAVLFAVYDCEKYTPSNKVPRFEAAYAPDGIYFKNSELVRMEYAKWQAWAACSYSNFQILYIVAVELGYDGPPLALDRDSVAIPYVVRYLNERVFDRGATTIEQVADAYNSGSFKDTIKPEHYIAKFKRQYAWHEEHECQQDSTNEDNSSSTES